MLIDFKRYFIVALLSCMSHTLMMAQVSLGSSESTTYLLPDGKVFDMAKFDSLSNAWGKDRVIFKHDEKDDEKNTIHLIRMTDEMKKKFESSHVNSDKTFASMLDKTAPEFELTDLDAKKWSLKNLHGKVVVLNFWFTTCIPCINEIPDLNKLVHAYGGKDVAFLGLTFNNNDQVKKFLIKHSFKFTLLPNSKNIDKKYQVSSWPVTIVIDKKGKIKKIITSSPNIHDELQSVINSLL